MDDVYIGQLIQAAGIGDEMANSMSICTGFNALQGDLRVGWSLDGFHRSGCLLAGLIVLHKYHTPGELTEAYAALTRITLSSIDKACYNYIYLLSQFTWGKVSHSAIFTEWERIFNHFKTLLPDDHMSKLNNEMTPAPTNLSNILQRDPP